MDGQYWVNTQIGSRAWLICWKILCSLLFLLSSSVSFLPFLPLFYSTSLFSYKLLQHSVRIPDLGLGNNPIRITSLRALPDADLDDVTSSLKDNEKELIRGEHVNWELSFAYRAAPNKTLWQEKAENIQYAIISLMCLTMGLLEKSCLLTWRNSLLVEFYLGIKGVAAIPIREFSPLWSRVQ